VVAFLVDRFNKNRLRSKVIEAERELESTLENTITKCSEWVSEIGGRESLLNLGKLNALINIYASSVSKKSDESSIGVSSGYHI
jgi:hypothetical protein